MNPVKEEKHHKIDKILQKLHLRKKKKDKVNDQEDEDSSGEEELDREDQGMDPAKDVEPVVEEEHEKRHKHKHVEKEAEVEDRKEDEMEDEMEDKMDEKPRKHRKHKHVVEEDDEKDADKDEAEDEMEDEMEDKMEDRLDEKPRKHRKHKHVEKEAEVEDRKEDEKPRKHHKHKHVDKEDSMGDEKHHKHKDKEDKMEDEPVVMETQILMMGDEKDNAFDLGKEGIDPIVLLTSEQGTDLDKPQGIDLPLVDDELESGTVIRITEFKLGTDPNKLDETAATEGMGDEEPVSVETAVLMMGVVTDPTMLEEKKSEGVLATERERERELELERNEKGIEKNMLLGETGHEGIMKPIPLGENVLLGEKLPVEPEKEKILNLNQILEDQEADPTQEIGPEEIPRMGAELEHGVALQERERGELSLSSDAFKPVGERVHSGATDPVEKGGEQVSDAISEIIKGVDFQVHKNQALDSELPVADRIQAGAQAVADKIQQNFFWVKKELTPDPTKET